MSAAGEMVRLSAELAAGVDALVGAEERDGFVAKAVARAVQSEQNRREIRRILQEEGPIWKEENHPELAGGIAEDVHNMRRDYADRAAERMQIGEPDSRDIDVEPWGPEERDGFMAGAIARARAAAESQEASPAERRARLTEVLRNTTPIMRDEDHPEFAEGTEAYVRRLRAGWQPREEAAEAAWTSD